MCSDTALDQAAVDCELTNLGLVNGEHGAPNADGAADPSPPSGNAGQGNSACRNSACGNCTERNAGTFVTPRHMLDEQ